MPALSVVVAVFNKPRELGLFLAALRIQTFSDFDVIIADDGSGPEVRELVAEATSRRELAITHVWHDHVGFRKTRILNQAVRRARTPYFLFLDGDCVPRSDCVSQHLQFLNPNTVLCGARACLGDKLSARIDEEAIRTKRLERNLVGLLWDSVRPGLHRSRHVEEAIPFSGTALFRRLPMSGNPRLTGCNFSISRSLLEAVNGFDEDYPGAGFGEDVDLAYRLKLAGASFASVRHKAIVYHVYHQRGFADPACLTYFNRVKLRSSPVCQHGLRTLARPDRAEG